MKKFLKKRSKGFTLVELLIVIIIIGILAGMMMLSTGGATAKAEATKIVSDMRNIKAAAIMYYADHGSWTDKIASLDTYMDQKISGGNYDLETDSFVEYDATSADENIRTALKNMAEKVALRKNATSSDDKYEGSGPVYMPIK